MERYRSGHNEAVLKTVCPQGRVGSNPTLSASRLWIYPKPFYFVNAVYHQTNRCGVILNEMNRRGPMHYTLNTFLIICPLVFIAGLVDSIGGGGGLISIPAFLMAGVPPHAAIATNKMSSVGGTSLTTYHFYKNKCISLKLSIPTVIAAVIGAYMGAHISLMVSEKFMTIILLILLPVSAALVLNKRLFNDNGKDLVLLDRKTLVVAVISAFVIGAYDGFYGPGTGTFLIIAFTVCAGLSMKSANGQAKVINLTTNITSLIVFLINGQVIIPIGVAACVCNMLGGYVGARLALKGGAKIVKPTILIVLVLLLIKTIVD